MIYRITVNTILLSRKQTEIITKNRQIIASSTGALMSASFIIAFKQVFKKVSLWLTELEDHRTQYEFDNAYVYKVYGFEFVNNYAAPMYIAFFKGRFFTHPGDLKVWKAYGGLGSDYCDTSGCTLDLCVQLFTIMAVKTLFSNITQYVNPIIQKKLQICLKRVSRHTQLPFYQEEFIKPKTDYFFLIDEYVEQVILYGFVVFFIAAFPLAPLLAFATCVGELRTDASKITRNYRRPIPQRVTGLGAWLVILQAVTYVGVVTNAFMIAFTSNVVDFEVYRLHWFSTGGFHNTTISAFDIRDFVFFETKQVQEWCYYPGRRYPPDHPRKYQVTTDYWFMLGLRFSVVVIFEHILMVIKGILAYAIPDIPNRVLVELAKEKRKEISA
ncbi:unnamed protein product [Psylliodes chrysocephalus]|uniref:Anoctamin n=1 Tax=Psylliodes chrysocephalus TaxID=3402493 RepID=A0A9P0GEQ8_9CUCU|nr:unnamed protein product [Psylliodes chrysocephala]